jgi:hypothetical protein
MRTDISEYFPDYAAYPSLDQNLLLDLSELSTSLMINPTDMSQYLHKKQIYKHLSGLIIKFNPLNNLMIFVKILDITDFNNTYTIVLCFKNTTVYENVLANLEQGNYIWTAKKGNKGISLTIKLQKFLSVKRSNSNSIST